jgi:tryptophanyl-tRNA synthetase
MSSVRFLTGITTSGTPHLGNYVGSIRPAVAASLRPGVESYYFLADYHALIKINEPERIQRSTLEIAASWLAAGLDPTRVVFYRQSDVPEIPELTWFLTCVTGKGILNRAHAYKASVDKNLAAELDPDADVTAGLFMYPVLMGADILMFNAHHVPVGRDQIQHIEMARDMAHSFNHRYGEHFVAPLAAIEESVATPARPGRAQDEQELRQHHPAVCAARRTQKAHRRNQDRFACARRGQEHRRLGLVPDLPGLCQRRRDRRICTSLCRRHCLGRRQRAAV